MSYYSRAIVNAPAKVNLSLDIKGVDGNGYHLMEMVMLSVELSDIVIINRNESNIIKTTSSSSEIPQSDGNIATIAAKFFFDVTGLKDNGLSIYIDKRIPIQAGLAGGSADAAAVIVGLNEIYQAKLPQSKLCEIGLLCGADVPFCIVGGCCLAQGIGEKLTKIPHNNGFLVVIAKPKIGVSTKKAFLEYDNFNGDIIRPNTKAMLNAISNNKITEIGNNMINVFEQIRFMQEIEDLKHIMLSNHALGAVMTGSGTAVIGLYKDLKAAQEAVCHVKTLTQEVYVSRPNKLGANTIYLD